MSVRAVDIPLVLVNAKIELCTMLDDGAVERGQKHMVLIVEFRNRNNEKAMIFSGVAVHNR